MTDLPIARLVGVIENAGEHGAGATFGVSLATLLQCLCIAEQRFLVPPLEADWEAQTLPTDFRAMVTLRSTQI